MTDRNTFGPLLKCERERRGIALSTIAESTKIKESVLAALERNDFRFWPEGIFRRAYLRAYASAIGLPPEPLVAEFAQLFPEEDQAPEVLGHSGQEAATSQLDPPSFDPDHAWPNRFRAAVCDAATVVLIAGIAAGAIGFALWPSIAIVGLGYLIGGTAWPDRSMGAFLLNKTDAWLLDRTDAVPRSNPTTRELALVAPPARRRLEARLDDDKPAIQASRASA